MNPALARRARLQARLRRAQVLAERRASDVRRLSRSREGGGTSRVSGVQEGARPGP